MRLEGPLTQVNKSAQAVYEAVNDVRRYEEFMPDAVSEFRTGEDFGMPWFAFSIGGMPQMGRGEKVESFKKKTIAL